MTLPVPAYPKPPAQVEPYFRVLGPDLTVDFLLQFGGAPIYMAENPKGRGQLERLYGSDKAAELAASCGHLFKKRVPLAKRWLARMLHWKGHTKVQIARTLRASDVSVSAWLSDRQGKSGYG
jgi:hypothetical protein